VLYVLQPGIQKDPKSNSCHYSETADIKINGGMGLNNIRKRLALMHPENIILTTTRSKFALESYDLNVIDYLLKPVSFERFMKAVGKVLRVRKNSAYITGNLWGKWNPVR
jgi:two-component SAPR family response regulator